MLVNGRKSSNYSNNTNNSINKMPTQKVMTTIVMIKTKGEGLPRREVQRCQKKIEKIKYPLIHRAQTYSHTHTYTKRQLRKLKGKRKRSLAKDVTKRHPSKVLVTMHSGRKFQK